MAEIYLADIRRIAPRVSELQERLAAALPERARQAARFAREEDRLRSLAAGLLLQDVLGACTILFGAHGKPYVPDGPHFNLSHYGDYVLLAVDAHPVGVDLEKHAERDFAALARFAFHPEERERFGPDLQARAFFDIWTLK